MPAVQFELLYVGEDGRWDNTCEGPWPDAQQAIDFAVAECGSPWIVVDASNRPVAFGDGDGRKDLAVTTPDSKAFDAMFQ